MEEETDGMELGIPSLGNFSNLDPDHREKEIQIAESLAAKHLLYEEQVSIAHDFFGGNYENFLKSFCFAKLQNIEQQLIIQNFQRDKCRDLKINAQDLRRTTVTQLQEKFRENPEECQLVLQKKENLKKQISRKLGLKLKTFKDQWVCAQILEG